MKGGGGFLQKETQRTVLCATASWGHHARQPGHRVVGVEPDSEFSPAQTLRVAARFTAHRGRRPALITSPVWETLLSVLGR